MLKRAKIINLTRSMCPHECMEGRICMASHVSNQAHNGGKLVPMLQHVAIIDWLKRPQLHAFESKGM